MCRRRLGDARDGISRPDNGALCALRRGAATLDCSLQTADGVPGALTVVSGTPAFADTAQDALQSIDSAALLVPVPLGVDLPDAALIADRDTQGRLPAVVPTPNRLVLADSSGLPATAQAGHRSRSGSARVGSPPRSRPTAWSR